VVADIEEGTSPRYRLLESTRQYARDRQKQAGEAIKLARKHCEVFRDIAIALDERLLRARDRKAAQVLVPELDNLRAAVSFGFGADGDIDVAADIISAGYHVWIQSTARAEPIALAVAALERLPIDESASRRSSRAKLQLAAAYLCDVVRRDKEGLEYAERARAAFLDLGDRPRVCIASRCLSQASARTGRFEEGEALASEAVDIARDERMPFYLDRSLAALGFIAFERGDLDMARKAYDEARTLSANVESRELDVDAAQRFAELEFASGNVAAAVELGESIIAFSRLKALNVLPGNLINQTAYRLGADDRSGARTSAAEAFAFLSPEAAPIFYLVLIEHVAVLAALDGALEDAAVLLGFSSATLEKQGIRRERTEKVGFERLIALLEVLDPELRSKLFEKGAALDRNAAVERAKAVLAGSPA
jgi:tetratricopeptide (TPR) repeat protein